MVKLNLGGGHQKIPGYTNLDRKLGSEVYPLDYEDGTVDEIRASHILEHFSHREAPEVLAREVAVLTAELRSIGLFKPPGVAETIDWVRALTVMGRTGVDAESVDASLGAVVKYREDLDRVRARGVAELVDSARRPD